MPAVCRLRLATRGNTHLAADDVLFALDCGVNYWNWCGHDDGMSAAIRQLGPQRSQVVCAAQISAAGWTRDSMRREIDDMLKRLCTDWIDILTLYYVESEGEWERIIADEGAIRALEEAKDDGRLRAIGLTTHQRPLAAKWVESKLLDLLMVRYNAAHRRAETEVFPVTDRVGLPVVGFTCLRWGALLKPTEQDPGGFNIPAAAEWYRYVLSHPSISVALMAPNGRAELEQNLTLLGDWRELPAADRAAMSAHGDRVRRAAGPFP